MTDNPFKGKKGIAIEAHPDDLILNAGAISELCKETAKHKDSEFFFITALLDQHGVRADYCNPFLNIYPETLNVSDELKRFIRTLEANQGAEVLELANKHKILDIDFDLLNPIYNKLRLISADSVFGMPSEKDQQKIDRFISEYEGDYYLMASPFSKHPHHRVVTLMFLKAIFKQNKNAKIYFWEEKEVFYDNKVEANTVFVFDDKTQEQKKDRLLLAYPSQHSRKEKEGHSYNYYGDISEEVAKEAFEQEREDLVNVPDNHKYAERLIAVTFEQTDELVDTENEIDSSYSLKKDPNFDHVQEVLYETEKDEEKKYDDLTTYAKHELEQSVVYVLGTNWIPKYDENDSINHMFLNPVITDMVDYARSKNIPFIYGNEESLISKIQDQRKIDGYENAKIIMLAKKDFILDEGSVLQNGKNVLVGVDSELLEDGNYIRLRQMFNFALALLIYPEYVSNSLNIPIEKINGIWVFLPNVQKLETRILKKVYTPDKCA